MYMRENSEQTPHVVKCLLCLRSCTNLCAHIRQTDRCNYCLIERQQGLIQTAIELNLDFDYCYQLNEQKGITEENRCFA